MVVIVGLGNPGAKFQNTRHNIGFMALDKFAEKNNFPEFKLDKKSNALVSENKNIILAKPQTFMNNSGLAVKNLVRSDLTKNLIVVHDDADLPVGKIKIVKDRGSAGHKGVESIIKAIGNKNLIRIRIGIAPQSRVSDHRTKAEKVVLKNFLPEEQKFINEVLEKICDALNLFIAAGPERTMNQFN